MKRRDFLKVAAAGIAAPVVISRSVLAAVERKRILFFSRSVLFQHDVVRRQGDRLSLAETILTDLGKQAGFDVDCTKDGTCFEGDLKRYSAVVAYSCGSASDMMKPKSLDASRPMSAQGEQNLRAAIVAGLGFVAVHPGISLLPDVIGAGCIGHGSQQEAVMMVTSPKFPGVEGLGKSFSLKEEWFALKDFQPDLHVILAQDPSSMAKPTAADQRLYSRPPFPTTWARLHGKGRVFYTSLGHREDVWSGKRFQGILLGGLSWSLGCIDTDIRANVSVVTPAAGQLTK